VSGTEKYMSFIESRSRDWKKLIPICIMHCEWRKGVDTAKIWGTHRELAVKIIESLAFCPFEVFRC